MVYPPPPDSFINATPECSLSNVAKLSQDVRLLKLLPQPRTQALMASTQLLTGLGTLPYLVMVSILLILSRLKAEMALAIITLEIFFVKYYLVYCHYLAKQPSLDSTRLIGGLSLDMHKL